jgi:hypothetical protein
MNEVRAERRARGRRRGGAAGRAHGGQPSRPRASSAQHPEFRDPERRGAGDHRGTPRPCWRRSASISSTTRRAGAVARGRADVQGERVRIPRGLARQLCATAPAIYPARPQPRAQRRDRRAQPGAGAGLWPALRARPRRRAALCHDRGFPQLREAGLHVEMAAPFGRHGLRAHRHRGEQAPSGHAAGAYDAVGQALHGVGHRTRARRGFGRDVRDPVRRGFRATEHGDDLAHQHQLAADL